MPWAHDMVCAAAGRAWGGGTECSWAASSYADRFSAAFPVAAENSLADALAPIRWVVVDSPPRLPTFPYSRKVPRMARYKISTAPADPVRPYLEGVAKNLVDRLYGEKGPAWGTQLTAIEDTIKAVRQVLSEKMLDEALQRQAHTVEDRPADFQCCHACGKGVERDPESDDFRILQTDVGEAEWREPATYCRHCRRSFFPSDQKLGHRPHRVEPILATQDRARRHEELLVQGW